MWGSKRIPFFAYFFGGEQKRAEEEAAPPIPGKFLPSLPLFKASDCPNVCKQSIESTNLAPRHLTYKDDSVTRFGEISPILQKVLSLWPMDSWFLIWQNVEPSLANLVHYWPNFHCCWRPNINNLVTLKVEPRGPGGAFFGHCKNGTKPKFAKIYFFFFAAALFRRLATAPFHVTQYFFDHSDSHVVGRGAVWPDWAIFGSSSQQICLGIKVANKDWWLFGVILKKVSCIFLN